MIGNIRMPNRAEKDRIKRREMADSVFRHHSAGLDVGLAAPVEVAPIKSKTEALAGGVEDANAFGDDLLADPVAGDHCDHVSLHLAGSRASVTPPVAPF